MSPLTLTNCVRSRDDTAFVSNSYPPMNPGFALGEHALFPQETHLCTLTCRAARPRPDSSRRVDRRALRALTAAERPSTRSPGSRSSHPRDSRRILPASIHGRVRCEIRPGKSQRCWISRPHESVKRLLNIRKKDLSIFSDQQVLIFTL